MAITIPSFSQDRGPLKVDPVTGSTLNDVSAYCRDLKGCGEADYLFLSQSMSINKCDTALCQRTFVASASISLIIDGDGSTSADVDTLVDYIQANLKAAFVTCPPSGG